MAISVTDLAIAVRLAVTEQEVTPEIRTQLERLLTWATLTVNRNAPKAPDIVEEMAIIALVGYMYDRPSSWKRFSFSNVWLNSGAASMLKPWSSELVAVALDESTIAATPVQRPDPDTPFTGLTSTLHPFYAGLIEGGASYTFSDATLRSRNGVIMLPAFTDKRLLIFKRAADGDLTKVVFSDSDMINQIGAFDRQSAQVNILEEVYSVWQSEEVLTHPEIVDMEVA